MKNNYLVRAQLPVLGLILAFTSACSTVSPTQLSSIEAKATSAMSEARKAAGDAASALKAAQAAQASADAAAATAAAAKSTAESAMSCCNENKDRIERMFEQTNEKVSVSAALPDVKPRSCGVFFARTTLKRTSAKVNVHAREQGARRATQLWGVRCLSFVKATGSMLLALPSAVGRYQFYAGCRS